MKKVTTVLLILTGFFPLLSHGQSSQFTKDLFRLINEARSNPSGFLSVHKSRLKSLSPEYVKFLERTAPIEKVVWDKGLEAMAREVVVKRALSPQYAGQNKLCGYASGSSMGDISSDPLPYLCGFYHNVHNPDNVFFGAYHTEKGYSFFWGSACEGKRFEIEPMKEIDMSGVDLERLNTGKNESYLNQDEKDMIRELNFARAYPRQYIKVVHDYLVERSKIWGGISTSEKVAYEDLVEQLSTMEPVSILQPQACIYKAARRHGLDMKKNEFSGHTGSDGSHPWERIEDACPSYRDGNENLVAGTRCSPRRGVIMLLIDSGISSRGHRHNMLDPKWEFVNCFQFEGKTDEYGTEIGYVQNFAR